ncbi:MAG: glycosyltransferase family 1 protein [Rhodospirillaceae bacterium]|nr:glycosyltransferase family 1 protein [Rhodospirillaceae bacterium]
MDSKLRIVVTGLVGLYPVGGVAWDYLQYAIGLRRLGHDVYYHEGTGAWPYQPRERARSADGSYSASFFKAFFERNAPDLAERWHYFHLDQTSYGMDMTSFEAVARTADLWLNVSGASPFPIFLNPRCVKAFIDTDPGYNQIVLSERFPWSWNVPEWSCGVASHDRYFTYAENIRSADCSVPKLRYDWTPTRMPIVSSLWTHIAPAPEKAPWTTVMTWNDFKGPLTYRGARYYSKDAEFGRLIDLPRGAGGGLAFKLAIGGKYPPVMRAQVGGWETIDGPTATLTPEDYRLFLAGSRGEISTAKHVYVAMRTGWFSCRSACYMAAGRPVVVQDTGFPAALPVGLGVVPFTTKEEAIAGIQAVEADYPRHARAAREIARDYFDSDRVLSQLIDDAMRPS